MHSIPLNIVISIFLYFVNYYKLKICNSSEIMSVWVWEYG